MKARRFRTDAKVFLPISAGNRNRDLQQDALATRHTPYPTITVSPRSKPRKETRRKERRREKNEEKGSGQRAKPYTPTVPTDALIGEVEQNIKQKKEQKKETGKGSSTKLP